MSELTLETHERLLGRELEDESSLGRLCYRTHVRCQAGLVPPNRRRLSAFSFAATNELYDSLSHTM